MASTTDIWAVTPVYSATLLRAAATVAGAGDVPLLSYQPLGPSSQTVWLFLDVD